MITGLIWTMLSSTLGTFGFALLLHAPRKAWLSASLIGGLGYTLYWGLMQIGWGEPAAMFVGVLVASILAQVAARKMRMIATIFITLAIIPCVPGLGLYRCMAYLGQGMNAEGLRTGVNAMICIGMIALALGVGSFIARRVTQFIKVK